MRTRILKATLAVGLAFLMIWICIDTWSRTHPAPNAEGPLPGYIVAFSDVPAARTAFWLDFDAARPGDTQQTENMEFSYRLRQSAPAPATVGFVLSGRYADMLTSCDSQSIEIDRRLRFDDLPKSARLALIALEQRGQQTRAQGLPVKMDRIEAAERASKEQNFTKVTIPITPKPGGAAATDAGPDPSVGAEEYHHCGANLQGMWNSVSGGYRIMTPPVAAAAPKAGATYTVSIDPLVNVKTDDQFFALRGSSEIAQSGSLTTLTVKDSTDETVEDYDNSVTPSMSGTFSSTAVQDSERNSILFIGVLLGSAASILIAVLSDAFDILASRVGSRSDRGEL